MINEIQGDRSCPVILTVSASDTRRNELAKLAWRARMESGELPLIFLNPDDSASDKRLVEWAHATIQNSGQRVRLIELKSRRDEQVRVNLAFGTVDHKSEFAVAESLTKAHGFDAIVAAYRLAEEFERGNITGWQLDLPDPIVAAPEDDENLGRLVLLLSDMIRHGCGASTIDSDIPDYFALLAAFDVTDRGSLTREINRRIGMPPGIGIEFYAQPLDDGDWDTWIGAGGQGNGFSFPTSIAFTLECARKAFDDYVGDHYRDLKFDTDWYPRPSHAAPSDGRVSRRDGADLSSIGRLITIAHAIDPHFARACLTAIEDFSETEDLAGRLVVDIGYLLENIEDEGRELEGPQQGEASEIAQVYADHAYWTVVCRQLGELAEYDDSETDPDAITCRYPVEFTLPGANRDREGPDE